MTVGFIDNGNFADLWLCFDRGCLSSLIHNVLDSVVRYTERRDQISVRLFRPSAEVSTLANLLGSGDRVIMLSDQILSEARAMMKTVWDERMDSRMDSQLSFSSQLDATCPTLSHLIGCV